MEKVATLVIIICLGAIILYNLYMTLKMWGAVHWILTHVKVVSKNDQKDPDFKRVKQIFGIKEQDSNEEETEHGK